MRGVVLLVSCGVFLFGFVKSQEFKCYRPNEELRCVSVCPPERTCKNRFIQFSCLVGKQRCQLKCVCQEGFYRNAIGECISEKQCDQCSQPHEYYTCGGACDNECATLHTQNKTNCPIVNIKCNEKCYCEDGYARDKNNACVPISECQETSALARSKRQSDDITCGPHEVYMCQKSCPPEKCFSIVARFRCKSDESCKFGCFCMPGFLRQSDGSPCVPLKQCPELANSPDFN